MSQTNVDLVWVKTYEAEGTITANSLVILGTASNQAIIPSSATTHPLGVAIEDAADDEPVKVCIIGDVYIIDHVGSLNRGDRIFGSTTSSYYHTVIVATQGTHGTFGTVIGDDAATADDVVLCRVNFAKPADIA